MNDMSNDGFGLSWIAVGRVSDIPVQGSRVIKSYLGDIAIFRAADDHVFALRNQCPHKGGPLSEGIVHGHSVTCPLHNWVISLETGEVLGPDEGCARVIGVKIDKGEISIDLSRLALMQAAE